MEKLLTQYFILLKNNISKVFTWVVISMMLLLCSVVENITIPDSGNTVAGVVKSDSVSADKILEILQNNNSIIKLRLYDNSDSLCNDITEGKVTCGFSFCEDFDQCIKNQDINGTVTYISGAIDTTGEIAKEMFYTAFLQVYTDSIYDNSEKEVFGFSDNNRKSEVFDTFSKYLDSDMVFDVDKVEVHSVSKTSYTNNDECHSVNGIIGITILLIMILSMFNLKSESYSEYTNALSIKNRLVFECTSQIAAATPVAVIGFVYLLITGNSRGVWLELLLILALLLSGTVYNIIIFTVIKSETSIYSFIIIFILLSIIFFPVFFDLSRYIPALKTIRMVFPLGIYLQ